jgi:hypothetical protein
MPEGHTQKGWNIPETKVNDMGKNKIHGEGSPFPHTKKSKRQTKGVFHA